MHTDDLGEEIPLLILSNEPTELKVRTLELLYQSLAYGQLGYMDGKDPTTGEIVPLLVGLQPTEDGRMQIFPIAKLFQKEDPQVNYQVPDGIGQYRDVSVGEPIDLTILSEEAEGKTEGLDKESIH